MVSGVCLAMSLTGASIRRADQGLVGVPRIHMRFEPWGFGALEEVGSTTTFARTVGRGLRSAMYNPKNNDGVG